MHTRTLFIGTSEFAVPILNKILELDYLDLVGVITQPDRPVGRKQTITATAVKLSIIDYQFPIKMFQPESLKVEAESILNEIKPELIIVASYGQFIPKVMLDYPKFKCLNIHGSLLPDLRGAVPIPMAILKGYKKTGVTLQVMSEGMDEGDVIGFREKGIEDSETTGSLIKKLSELSVELIEEVLPKWLEGELKPQKQDGSKATYCYIKDFTKERAEIDWKRSAIEIERMVRAFNPAPIAWTKFTNHKFLISKKLQIYSCKLVGDQNLDPVVENQTSIGNIFRKGKQLFVRCGDDMYLELLELQLEGKERRNASEYLFLGD